MDLSTAISGKPERAAIGRGLSHPRYGLARRKSRGLMKRIPSAEAKAQPPAARRQTFSPQVGSSSLPQGAMPAGSGVRPCPSSRWSLAPMRTRNRPSPSGNACSDASRHDDDGRPVGRSILTKTLEIPSLPVHVPILGTSDFSLSRRSEAKTDLPAQTKRADRHPKPVVCVRFPKPFQFLAHSAKNSNWRCLLTLVGTAIVGEAYEIPGHRSR